MTTGPASALEWIRRLHNRYRHCTWSTSTHLTHPRSSKQQDPSFEMSEAGRHPHVPTCTPLRRPHRLIGARLRTLFILTCWHGGRRGHLPHMLVPIASPAPAMPLELSSSTEPMCAVNASCGSVRWRAEHARGGGGAVRWGGVRGVSVEIGVGVSASARKTGCDGAHSRWRRARPPGCDACCASSVRPLHA